MIHYLCSKWYFFPPSFRLASSSTERKLKWKILSFLIQNTNSGEFFFSHWISLLIRDVITVTSSWEDIRERARERVKSILFSARNNQAFYYAPQFFFSQWTILFFSFFLYRNKYAVGYLWNKDDLCLHWGFLTKWLFVKKIIFFLLSINSNFLYHILHVYHLKLSLIIFILIEKAVIYENRYIWS